MSNFTHKFDCTELQAVCPHASRRMLKGTLSMLSNLGRGSQGYRRVCATKSHRGKTEQHLEGLDDIDVPVEGGTDLRTQSEASRPCNMVRLPLD